MSSADTLAALFRDPEFAAYWREIDEDEKALVEFWAQIRDVEDEHRHQTLVWFARSPWWHPAGMLLLDWQGKLHRDAWRALKRELDADTPANRWYKLPYDTGRESIHRLLGVGEHAARVYAAAAFKAWSDDDGRFWIAGAVGAPPIFGTPRELNDWRHLDIRDIVLWDPRTNEGRLVGEHHSTALIVLPDLLDTSVTVWGDAGAFFKAWAAKRARFGEVRRVTAARKGAAQLTEPSDGGLPGALVIGDIGRLHWPHVAVETVHAGPGMTPAELHFAAVRAASLPRFEGFRGGRGS